MRGISVLSVMLFTLYFSALPAAEKPTETRYCGKKGKPIFGYQLMNSAERAVYCKKITTLKRSERRKYISEHKKKMKQRALDVGYRL